MWARLLGVARSLLMYYGQPWRRRRMRRFYSQFMGDGSLCFDVGAHAGNRIRCWRSLGARVVAVEPQADSRFRSVQWDQREIVRVETLDTLIARHGVPDFCKIDVEGMELSVLQGLSQPLPAVSFECIPVTVQRAHDCIDALEALADYRFRRSVRESMRRAEIGWVSGWQIEAHVAGASAGRPLG